ncbi:hypothetical protein JMUB6875_43130 [Nocardia sp. JMUB6875]|uniref:cysteine hydrolase n=1 Tax=Nocardia sp. JMUB6875 TaxID=3158170 RepID=UPI0032E5BC1F
MNYLSSRAAVLALHWQVNVVRPQGFFGPLLAEPVATSGVIERAVRFHRDAAKAGLPIVFTRFTIPTDEGLLVRNTGFMQSVADAQANFHPESAGTALIPEMEAQATVVFDNQKLSGFAGSNLADWLAERDIDTLFITGVATNLTVEQTARQGTDLGFFIHPITDCVATTTECVGASSLANLELTTAGCLTAAEASARILAQHDVPGLTGFRGSGE